jgi:hypothetical protein
MTYEETLEILRELEDLLLRESIDNPDPETIAMITEISAEVNILRKRIAGISFRV